MCRGREPERPHITKLEHLARPAEGRASDSARPWGSQAKRIARPQRTSCLQTVGALQPRSFAAASATDALHDLVWNPRDRDDHTQRIRRRAAGDLELSLLGLWSVGEHVELVPALGLAVGVGPDLKGLAADECELPPCGRFDFHCSDYLGDREQIVAIAIARVLMSGSAEASCRARLARGSITGYTPEYGQGDDFTTG